MARKFFQLFIIVLVLNFLFTGCATVLSNYEASVDLINAPDDIEVFSRDGVEIPISTRIVRQYSEESKTFENKEIKIINLRKNKEHILLLKSNAYEKLIEVYPRILGAWLILDFLTGIFPAFIDAYTGNWNYFPPIDARL